MSNDWFSSIKEIKLSIESFEINSLDALEHFRIRFLGSKNIIKPVFGEIGKVPVELKKAYGQQVNELKQLAEEKFESASMQLSSIAETPQDIPDLSLPAVDFGKGSRHPISLVMDRIIDIFTKIGFQVSEDREIEDEWYNFTSLNTPDDHPARDMQDTFFVQQNPDVVLRTHTSSVQIRVLENAKPPVRIIMPGRVYRNETISARAHCFFHQVEGLYVDEKVSFADLKQTLDYFSREMFGEGTKIKMRPSYFPFTEPSAEVDVTCFLCNGAGCNVCKYTGWVEILGCGMVDPAVLKNCGIDSEKYSGFAFGMGVERITMLKYQIKDIRLLSENDSRFLSQFRAAW